MNGLLTWEGIGVHVLDCGLRDAVLEAKATHHRQRRGILRRKKRYELFMARLVPRSDISGKAEHFVNTCAGKSNLEDRFYLCQPSVNGRRTIAGNEDQAVDFLFEFRNPVGIKGARG